MCGWNHGTPGRLEQSQCSGPAAQLPHEHAQKQCQGINACMPTCFNKYCSNHRCLYCTRLLTACTSLVNPRRACTARVTVVGSVCLSVCVCMCVSVKSHLTSGASVRPENTVTYPVGNEGQKICGVFSETAPLWRSSTAPLKSYIWSAIFLRKACMCIV